MSEIFLTMQVCVWRRNLLAWKMAPSLTTGSQLRLIGITWTITDRGRRDSILRVCSLSGADDRAELRPALVRV